MGSWGTVSFLEGVRLVLALVGIGASLWAIAHSRDGSLAFAAPIRERMVWRRRVQMAGNLAIFLILGAQTFSAALVPDPPVISAAGSAVSYAYIAVMGILLTMTLMFSIGWAGVEEILGRTPLVLPADAYVTETVLSGRQIIHDINGELGLLVGELELLNADPNLTQAQRVALVRMNEHADTVCHQVIDVQQLVRSLSQNAQKPSEAS